MQFQSVLLFSVVVTCTAVLRKDCQPIYVRWTGVKIGTSPRLSGPYGLTYCRKHCSDEEHTVIKTASLPCAGFNFKKGANEMANLCEYFDDEQMENLDWYVEADSRYSFFRKYCVKSKNICKLPSQFEFYIDRYMDSSQINRDLTVPLEECIDRCLDERAFKCRSLTYNRTSSLCRLSIQTKESQPEMVKVNSDPNFRIDYYENVCEGGIEMRHKCLQDGILVSAESKIPYSGAMYGLYDFVGCKIEPNHQMFFSIFMPYSPKSNNCSDSIRTQGDNYIAEVVVSSGGVKPLYYITERDIVYHAKCPKHEGNTDPSVGTATVNAAVDILPSSTVSTVNTEQTMFKILPEQPKTTVTQRIDTTVVRRTTASTYKVPKYTTEKSTSISSSTSTKPTTSRLTKWTSTSPTSSEAMRTSTASAVSLAVKFDILNNGQPITAVVIGSKVTLDFRVEPPSTGSDLVVLNCRIEPVDSPHTWERDPLQIIQEGCPADGVGLVCAPKRVEFGAQITMEAFRYTSTSKVRYSCETQVCEKTPCRRPKCPMVDGCQKLPDYSTSIGSLTNGSPSTGKIYNITKDLLVVNSEAELLYFLSTGNVPKGVHPPGGYFSL
ncbi:unnamed protein product [Soboliphyme baturini]|uniref:Apple domain-containing protein n=1 Tax=Soboliphyme baturini TaxID=241478 RepID=A0A183IL94_9BILA|nr:unnamed protein product [Soboliphyme baturini]